MSTAITQENLSTASGMPGDHPVPPRASVVVRAFFGATPPGGHEHPLLRVAAALAREHRLRAEAHQLAHDVHADDHVLAAATRSINASGTARAVLIEQIDIWSGTHLAESRAAMLHTETLGQLVDRLAAVWMRWRLLDEDSGSATCPTVRVALHQLAELSGAYDDLVTDLLTGRRRLPAYQTPTGPTATA